MLYLVKLCACTILLGHCIDPSAIRSLTLDGSIFWATPLLATFIANYAYTHSRVDYNRSGYAIVEISRSTRFSHFVNHVT